ncbi:MAG: P-loop NTPase [Candidatus Binataceae bacterium]
MKIFSEVETDAAAGLRIAEELSRIRANLSGAKAIVAIASAKGGVGKSALTANLAAAFALAGRKVGVIDADLNSPGIIMMLGMKPPLKNLLASEWLEPGAGPLGLRVASSNLLADGDPPPISFLEDDAATIPTAASNGRGPVELDYAATLRRLLGQTRFGALDLLLIDLAPGLDPLHRIAKLVPLSGVILVSQPSELAVRALGKAIELATHAHIPITGVVENMVGFNCEGCHSVRPLTPQGDLASLAREKGVPILARLPFDSRFAEACDHGVLFVREYNETPLGKQLIALAHAVDAALDAHHLTQVPAT